MEAKKSSVKEFLSAQNAYFQIPVYQRNFCWETSQCREFFDDILTCIENDKKHFIGTFVFKKDANNTNVIIDGQQRITSVSLLLKAVYDASDNEKLRTDIQKHYLMNPCEGGKFRLKLKPIQRDNGIYKTLLSHYHVNDSCFSDADMRTPLYSAFFNYRAWVKKEMDEPGFDKKLFDAIEALELVELSLDAENPQEIFESINNTGMSLSKIDVLRNYILMSMPYSEQVRMYEDYWMPIEETVSSERLADFVTAYIICKRQSHQITIGTRNVHIGPGTICECFKKLYPNIHKSTHVEDLFADMLRYSKLYARFCFSTKTETSTMRPVDTLLYELCYQLDGMGFAPLLMYILKDAADGVIAEQTVCAMLKSMISALFRSKVCGGNIAASGMTSTIMLRLEKGKDNYMRTFVSALTSGHGSTSYPTDFAFRQALMNPTIALKNATLKYMLYKIEKYFNPSQVNQMSAGTVEHIMPQNLSEAWEKYLSFNGDRGLHDELVNSIGNLTITEANSALSNKPFDAKKDLYADSLYHITKELCGVPVWNKKAIENRGERMAEAALKIWPSDKFSGTEFAWKKHTLSEDLSVYANTKPTSFTFLGEEVPCHTWIAMGVGVVKILYELDKTIIERLVDSDMLPREGMLSKEADEKRQASIIADGIWLNQAKSIPRLLRELQQLLARCGREDHSLVDELWFSIADDEDIIEMT